MASFPLLDDQLTVGTLEVDDDAGNAVPGAFDSPPVWTLVDPDGTLTLAVSADSLTATATATGKLTVTTDAIVNVAASVGGVALTGSQAIHVSLSAAATIKVSFGAPAHK